MIMGDTLKCINRAHGHIAANPCNKLAEGQRLEL